MNLIQIEFKVLFNFFSKFLFMNINKGVKRYKELLEFSIFGDFVKYILFFFFILLFSIFSKNLNPDISEFNIFLVILFFNICFSLVKFSLHLAKVFNNLFKFDNFIIEYLNSFFILLSFLVSIILEKYTECQSDNIKFLFKYSLFVFKSSSKKNHKFLVKFLADFCNRASKSFKLIFQIISDFFFFLIHLCLFHLVFLKF